MTTTAGTGAGVVGTSVAPVISRRVRVIVAVVGCPLLTGLRGVTVNVYRMAGSMANSVTVAAVDPVIAVAASLVLPIMPTGVAATVYPLIAGPCALAGRWLQLSMTSSGAAVVDAVEPKAGPRRPGAQPCRCVCRPR